MNLRKRIYLLTPVLVLCCVLAAGFFIKESAPVDAATIEKVGSYKPTKLKDVIDKEKTMTADEWAAYNGTDKAAAERFDIKEFNMKVNAHEYKLNECKTNMKNESNSFSWCNEYIKWDGPKRSDAFFTNR